MNDRQARTRATLTAIGCAIWVGGLVLLALGGCGIVLLAGR